VVLDATSFEPVAWFPEVLASRAKQLSGGVWAGGVAGYLCLFTLEGLDHPHGSENPQISQ